MRRGHGYAKSKPMPTDETPQKPPPSQAPEKPPLVSRPLKPAAQRAAAEAAARRANSKSGLSVQPKESGGRGGLEPTRYGDWEVNGLTSDF